jgi:hypothetical protein
MPGSALVPNYGTARRDPLQRGSEHWLTVLAVVEMVIGECQTCQGCRCCRCFCISFDYLSIVASDILGFMDSCYPLLACGCDSKAAEVPRAVEPLALRWF